MIRINPFQHTLDLYLLRKFTKNFFMFSLIFLSIIFLVEFVELLRRTSENPDIQSTYYVLYLSILKLSGSIVYIIPLIIFVTTMYTCWWLNRNKEIVIIQNIGLNSFRILYPFIFFTILFSLLYLFFLNPFLSQGTNQYQKIEQQFFHGKLSQSTINKSGVWLRQGSKENKIVIRAANYLPKFSLFKDVTFYIFTKKNTFIERIDTKKAKLEKNYWHMSNVTINRPNKKVANIEEYTLSTNLSINKIEDSFLEPQSISIWKLPSFIELLEQSGFSSTKHKIYLHKNYFFPLFLIGLVLLGGAFTLKFVKSKKESAYLILFSSVLGFFIYVLSEYIYSLGAADKIPSLLASLSPAIITNMMAIYFIFHFDNVK